MQVRDLLYLAQDWPVKFKLSLLPIGWKDPPKCTTGFITKVNNRAHQCVARGHQKSEKQTEAKSDSNVSLRAMRYLLCPADLWGLQVWWECLQLDWRGCSQSGHKPCGFKGIVEPRPAWVRIWDIFSLREDVKLPRCRAQASPQLPGIGKPPLWADNSMAACCSSSEAPINNCFQKPRVGLMDH